MLTFSVTSGGKLFIRYTPLDLKYFVASVVFVLYLCSFSTALVLWLCMVLFVLKIVGCIMEVSCVCACSRNLTF